MQSALECVQVSRCVDSLKLARSRDNQAVDTVGHKINSCLQQYQWFQNWQKKTSLVVILIVLLLKIDNLQLNVVSCTYKLILIYWNNATFFKNPTQPRFYRANTTWSFFLKLGITSINWGAKRKLNSLRKGKVLLHGSCNTNMQK